MININTYIQNYDTTLSVIDNCIRLLKMTNNEKTLEHIKNVSITGVTIANTYGLDKDKVEIACYLHDISVIVSRDEYIRICESHGMEVLEVKRKIPLLLHQ